jgi:hypothetical protein
MLPVHDHPPCMELSYTANQSKARVHLLPNPWHLQAKEDAVPLTFATLCLAVGTLSSLVVPKLCATLIDACTSAATTGDFDAAQKIVDGETMHVCADALPDPLQQHWYLYTPCPPCAHRIAEQLIIAVIVLGVGAVAGGLRSWLFQGAAERVVSGEGAMHGLRVTPHCKAVVSCSPRSCCTHTCVCQIFT